MSLFSHVKGNTYYLKAKTNIGLIIDNDNAILIDSGNDKESGRKIRQYLEKHQLRLKYILNTHSNADHIGANQYLLKQYNEAKAHTLGKEVIFTQHPDLEPCLLYGGFASKDMRNSFLMAKPSKISDVNEIQYCIKHIDIKGHFFDMVAYLSDDNVLFIGDSIFSKEIINKYHIFYILDVKAFLNTLDKLQELNDTRLYTFIPSHANISDNISDIITINRNKVNEIINLILSLINDNITFDLLLKQILDYYHLKLDLNQYLLVGSTIRNYLSYLKDEDIISFNFDNNQLTYKKNS